ncbi:zinc finger MYM-type protein 1-like [Rhopalosiphum padi]|uniref:zinc finger MYM-type protein 1-like n=1 Tax=Rhopalosiphum padi TaxID=40932 RepID=UPI00298DE56B|nr:zinc finger MYM-type protein 1-like [Rhopalosiphum padi]
MNNKRTKVQCLACGSSFGHEYRRKHELNIHGGSQVKVKDVSLGVANNPFAAARLNFERKVSKGDSDNVSLNKKCINNANSYNETVVSEVSKGDSDNVPINSNCVNKISIDISTSKNDSPVQPVLNVFPSTNGRRFSAMWYTYNWIEYSIAEDLIYCFACRHFSSLMNNPGTIIGKIPFVNYGLKCWKEPKQTLNSHCRNKKHLLSMTRWVDYRNIQKNVQQSIACNLNKARQQDIYENRLHVHFLLKSALFLAKQGLAFRGHNEMTSSNNKGNYLELLETFADDKLLVRLRSRYGHYTSPSYQNDLIKVLAECTKQNILNKMSLLGAFAILVDETKDASKKEQLSFVLRFVDKDFDVYEHALGCFHMTKSTAQSLSDEILKICIH